MFECKSAKKLESPKCKMDGWIVVVMFILSLPETHTCISFVTLSINEKKKKKKQMMPVCYIHWLTT